MIGCMFYLVMIGGEDIEYITHVRFCCWSVSFISLYLRWCSII